MLLERVFDMAGALCVVAELWLLTRERVFFFFFFWHAAGALCVCFVSGVLGDSLH